MTAWKQIIISLAILVAAAFAWVQFFPGAPEILNRWGIEWAQASTPKIETGSIEASKTAGKDQPSGPKATVITAPATLATINDRLQTIGSGRANATVAVTPYGSGRLEKLMVQSGGHIHSGQIIAELDSETEMIALERAKAARDDFNAKVERMRSLRSSNAATQVQLTDAELAQRNDELSVHDAQIALDRRSVTSPIAGVVGILPIEAGKLRDQSVDDCHG